MPTAGELDDLCPSGRRPTWSEDRKVTIERKTFNILRNAGESEAAPIRSDRRHRTAGNGEIARAAGLIQALGPVRPLGSTLPSLTSTAVAPPVAASAAAPSGNSSDAGDGCRSSAFIFGQDSDGDDYGFLGDADERQTEPPRPSGRPTFLKQVSFSDEHQPQPQSSGRPAHRLTNPEQRAGERIEQRAGERTRPSTGRRGSDEGSERTGPAMNPIFSRTVERSSKRADSGQSTAMTKQKTEPEAPSPRQRTEPDAGRLERRRSTTGPRKTWTGAASTFSSQSARGPSSQSHPVGGMTPRAPRAGSVDAARDDEKLVEPLMSGRRTQKDVDEDLDAVLNSWWKLEPPRHTNRTGSYNTSTSTPSAASNSNSNSSSVGIASGVVAASVAAGASREIKNESDESYSLKVLRALENKEMLQSAVATQFGQAVADEIPDFAQNTTGRDIDNSVLRVRAKITALLTNKSRFLADPFDRSGGGQDDFFQTASPEDNSAVPTSAAELADKAKMVGIGTALGMPDEAAAPNNSDLVAGWEENTGSKAAARRGSGR